MAVIREEKSNSKLVQLLSPVAITADKDDIAAVDVSGFDSVLLAAVIGAAAVDPADDKHVQIRIVHSDDNVTFEDCSDREVIGAVEGEKRGTFAYLKTKPDANTSFLVAYVGDRRYVKPVIKVTGDLGDGVLTGIAAILHGPKYRPVS